MYHNFSNILKSGSFFIVVMMLAVVQNAGAQNQKKVDSIKQIISVSKPALRIGAYLELCLEYGETRTPLALQYSDSAYQLSMSIGDSAQMVRAGRLKGQLLRRVGKLDESLLVLNLVLPIAKRNNRKEDYVKILNALAVGYTFKANFDEALKYHFESLVAREAEGNKAATSITLNNIGIVYFKLENYERALEYYNRSLVLKQEVKDTHDVDRLLINIGMCYNQLKNYKEAAKYINEGFKICGKDCDPAILMEGKLGLGISLRGIGSLEEAENYFMESQFLARQLQDTRFQLENLIFLARINNQFHKEDKVKKFLEEAETLAKNTAYNQIQIEIYREFIKLYEQTSDFRKASEYQNRYILLKDSIFSKELIKNLATVQTKYEERANIKTIADKNTALIIKEETLKRQSAESLFIVVVSILVFALATLMFFLFRLTQRANSLLEVRVEKRTKELNDSNEALAKVNGELDNFIYKTSHDIRGPLASLKGICNVAIMDVHDEAALGYLQKLDFTAEKLNRILTRLLIINQINHAVLAANVIVFEELLEEILFLERKKGIPKRLKIFYEIEKGFVLRSDKEMLRIVLENLIDNGIKFYSESDRIDPFVKIFIYAVEQSIVIKVIDNGVGITAETREKIFQMFVRASERSETGGIGLYLARLATGRIEGKIEFRTTPEKYTEFSVKLPLNLGPILQERADQDHIRELEKNPIIRKQNLFTTS